MLVIDWFTGHHDFQPTHETMVHNIFYLYWLLVHNNRCEKCKLKKRKLKYELSRQMWSTLVTFWFQSNNNIVIYNIDLRWYIVGWYIVCIHAIIPNVYSVDISLVVCSTIFNNFNVLASSLPWCHHSQRFQNVFLAHCSLFSPKYKHVWCNSIHDRYFQQHWTHVRFLNTCRAFYVL